MDELEKDVMPDGVAVETEVVERPLHKRIKERYKDEITDDISDLTSFEDRYSDDLENELSGLKVSEQEINDILLANPDLANLMSDIIVNKMPVKVAIARNFDMDSFEPVEGEPDYDGYKTAYEERIAKNKAYKELEEQIAANEVASMAEIDAFIAENNLDDAGREELVDLVNTTLENLIHKKIDRNFLGLIHKGKNSDKEKELAKEAGKIEGLNAQYVEQKAKKDKEKAGDGIPVPPRGSVAPEQKPKKENFFSDIERRNKW